VCNGRVRLTRAFCKNTFWWNGSQATGEKEKKAKIGNGILINIVVTTGLMFLEFCRFQIFADFSGVESLVLQSTPGFQNQKGICSKEELQA
jgi:hypothetical protein